jgi:hypothetical protein
MNNFNLISSSSNMPHTPFRLAQLQDNSAEFFELPIHDNLE